jgi:magnesium-transporting ATPase (P-type)
VIFGVVLVNALAGFTQEGKAESALAALARSVAAEATVLRAGVRRRLDAVALVPGDVVLLSAGDKVPADLRLLGGKALRAVEAALTGESVPVDKHAGPLPADTPLAERRNMAYAGTLVVAGQGMGIVVATGDATEAGRISRLIATAPELATPLTHRMGRFARHLLVAILLLAALTFAVGVLRGETAYDMFMAAVALAVGAIPEGLPAAMTITLAIGVGRMARRRAIIRRLPAVETLGSTTVICSDKTGTLTENAMTVREIRAGGEIFAVTGHGYASGGRIEQDGRAVEPTGVLREVLLAGSLCNDAQLLREGRHWTMAGDPTEGALLVAAHKGGLDPATLSSIFPRLDELPFDPARQSMATLHAIEGARILYAKGAAERLLPACATMLADDGRETLLDRAAVEHAAVRMTAEGLRVLALVRSELGANQALEHAHIGSGLVFLGLVGMLDPPRPRAISAVRACQGAGIRVKMITGDHPGTALAIARMLNIAGEDAGALTGRDLARLDDAALRMAAAEVDVFARIEPEQKLRLVQALQADGEVVAMTGDGVNDAPALKQADIGIAMGRGGTEVAKEAAAMVLTDDNFATIEAAVEEGRGIYDNLVKFIAWTIPTNAGEGLVILAAIFAGVALPITPLQILWINMTTAVLLGLTLAFEPAERGIMLRPPRAPSAAILDGRLLRRILLVSALLLVGAFGLFELALQRGQSLAGARTVAVNVFVMVETFYLFNCRSLTRSFWSVGLFSNPWLLAGSALMVTLQLAFTYLPVFNRVFHSAPIGGEAWLAIIGFAALCLVMVEIEKLRYP